MKKLVFFLCLFAGQIALAADYEILEKVETITVQSLGFATEHHREVVRILTEDGADYQKYLAVNSFIQIKNVKGSVLFPDGHTEQLKEEDISEVPISQSADMITDLKAVAVAPPWLVRGCTLTIEYDRSVTSLLYIDPWIYASTVPIRKAMATLTYPPSIPIKFQGQDDLVTVQKTEGTSVFVAFSSANRKEIALLGEPSASEDVDRKVTFLPDKCTIEKWTLSTDSWQSIAEWFAELSKFALQSDASMDAVVEDAKSKTKSDEELAGFLYEYVQRNFVYTAIEIGIGGYKPHFANQTFSKKYGDCKDLTFLYLMLLKKAGIEAYPALVDTRSGRFFRKDFPSPGQFNHCIAFLPKIRDGVFVDSTVKNFHLGEVPSLIQGHQALVVGPNQLMEIPRNFQESNVMRLSVTGALAGEEIQIKGRLDASGQGSMLVDAMKNVLVENAVKHYVYSTMIVEGTPLRKLETRREGDRALSLNYVTPLYASNRYHVFLVNPMNYPALRASAFTPQQDQYFAMGAPMRYVSEAMVDLAGHHLVSAPLAKEEKGEFMSYKLEWNEKDGKLHYLSDAYFSNGLLSDVEMKKYQEEIRAFAALLQRTVVVE